MRQAIPAFSVLAIASAIVLSALGQPPRPTPPAGAFTERTINTQPTIVEKSAKPVARPKYLAKKTVTYPPRIRATTTPKLSPAASFRWELTPAGTGTPTIYKANEFEAPVSDPPADEYVVHWVAQEPGGAQMDVFVTVRTSDEPTPPGPGPSDPTDPAWPALRAAFAKDVDQPGMPKKQAAKILAEFYRAAAGVVRQTKTATAEAFTNELLAKQAEMKVPELLPNARGVMRDEQRKIWPQPTYTNTPVTPALKEGTAKVYERMVPLMEALAK